MTFSFGGGGGMLQVTFSFGGGGGGGGMLQVTFSFVGNVTGDIFPWGNVTLTDWYITKFL